MNNLVEVRNDIEHGLVTTSRIISNGLGKRHADVIKSLDKILENENLRSVIIPTTYKVKNQKRSYREYLLTKDGFTLYMFNIQGHNDFKMAYIKRFNEMEDMLRRNSLNGFQQQPKIDQEYILEKKT